MKYDYKFIFTFLKLKITEWIKRFLRKGNFFKTEIQLKNFIVFAQFLNPKGFKN